MTFDEVPFRTEGGHHVVEWCRHAPFGEALQQWLRFARFVTANKPGGVNQKPVDAFMNRKLRLFLGQTLILSRDSHASRLPVKAGSFAVEFAEGRYTRANLIDITGAVERAYMRQMGARQHVDSPFVSVARLALRGAADHVANPDMGDACWQAGERFRSYYRATPGGGFERPYTSRWLLPILRDLFPAPYLWPEPIQTGTVPPHALAMAEEFRASGDESFLPILADALSDAGLPDACDTVMHLRGFDRCFCRWGGEHKPDELCSGTGWVRSAEHNRSVYGRGHFTGCWAVDRVLGCGRLLNDGGDSR
jgi:hypothetical protein